MRVIVWVWDYACEYVLVNDIIRNEETEHSLVCVNFFFDKRNETILAENKRQIVQYFMLYRKF